MEENQENSKDYSLNDLFIEISKLNNKIDTIEKNINGKTESLIDLLRDIVTTNLRNTHNPGSETVKSEPDLYYIIEEDFIFIKGKKTYQNKDKIKTSFNGVWNKEKSAWAFKKYEKFEEKLREIFPDITEGQ
jgi:hypothetical protein